ncbi:MAG: preprotein translocase subunit TatA [SAR86 cluster bacterium]|nr:preprotein translocase subunit TatA [SAR86 cluster bacterium]
MLKNIYKYPELERVDLDSGRHYLDSTGTPVPSVTTVLSNTSTKSDGIDKWRKRVGDIEADRIIKQSTDIGTAVHEALEAYLKKEEWDIFDISISDQNISKKISQKFIADGLNTLNEIWGLEVGLILDGLYAGTADCIGLVNGVPSIIDFKTAKKIKRREWIEDYFLQGCAYANAHNVMFGTNISQIVILMVDRDLVFQAFTVKTAEFNVLTRKWKNKLIQFDTQKIKEKS